MKIPYQHHASLAMIIVGIFASTLLFTPSVKSATMDATNTDKNTLKIATFAGGCFWCMEHTFEEIDGVQTVISGYTGGHTENPSYQTVSSGNTGHVEAIQISYNPSSISYEKLLDLYWRQIDPTDANGSFVDRGPQYRSIIFYHNSQQKEQALRSKTKLDRQGIYPKMIVTEILAATLFYPAEDYHQDYSMKNPIRYKFYRYRSGRDQYIEKTWGTMEATDAKMNDYTSSNYEKPSTNQLKERLTNLQFNVTQKDATERPYDNKYWDNKNAGIYVDIVSGEPLFSSIDKYNSNTGWPSFTKPIALNSLLEKEDKGLFISRTEVRSQLADSHLGHVFDDGPAPTGKRYCINSAAIRFIPKEELASEGYKKYAEIFM